MVRRKSSGPPALDPASGGGTTLAELVRGFQGSPVKVRSLKVTEEADDAEPLTFQKNTAEQAPRPHGRPPPPRRA